MLINSEDQKNFSTQIDNFVNRQPESSRSLVYFMGLAVAGALVWSFVSPITNKALQETKSSISSVQQKLSKTNSYLASHSDASLRNLKKTIASKERHYDNVIYKISYVDNKLNELNYLLFDDKSWANFVDKISELAKKYSVDIEEISNRFYKPTYQKITHVVEVDVKSKAKLKNMVKFLNAIEESKLVIDVNKISMDKPSDDIDGEFKIAVWGMKY